MTASEWDGTDKDLLDTISRICEKFDSELIDAGYFIDEQKNIISLYICAISDPDVMTRIVTKAIELIEEDREKTLKGEE